MASAGWITADRLQIGTAALGVEDADGGHAGDDIERAEASLHEADPAIDVPPEHAEEGRADGQPDDHARNEAAHDGIRAGSFAGSNEHPDHREGETEAEDG